MAQRRDGEDEADLEEEVSIPIEENVYSFFQFVVPLERQRTAGKKGVTTDMMMSYFLVFLCLFMQSLALYCIFNSVVINDIEWQNGVMTLGGKGWALFAPAEECNDGSSLCRVIDGEYTCAPPSVLLTGRWEELDVDGDGAWSYDEAVAEQEKLKCKYAVDPVEVFDVFKKILLTRESLIWLHPDVKAGKQIFLPYFKYLSGDVIMCGYGTSDMCPNLLQRGFFDSALVNQTSPRVGTTATSALKYCHALLDQGGTCEQLLPSTYAVWKKESVDQCGKPSFDRFDFFHPSTGKKRSLLEVDYKARKRYKKFQTPLFVLYKSIIILLWGLVMINEIKLIIKQINWVFDFPAERNLEASAEALGQEEAGAPRSPRSPRMCNNINGISASHRFMVGFITTLRSMMLVMLSWIGTQFLLKSAGYVDLLFDAVAVVFVLEFANVLYANTIRQKLREEIQECEPMVCTSKGAIRMLVQNPGIRDVAWLAALFITVAIVMYWHNTHTVQPIYDAVECTCLQLGNKCHEAIAFSAKFWNDYWLNTVPQVFQEVEALYHSAALQPTSIVFHVKERIGAHHRHVHHQHHLG